MRRIPQLPFHQGPCPPHLLDSAPLRVYYRPRPAILRVKSSTKHLFFLLEQVRNNPRTTGARKKNNSQAQVFELISTTEELLRSKAQTKLSDHPKIQVLKHLKPSIRTKSFGSQAPIFFQGLNLSCLFLATILLVMLRPFPPRKSSTAFFSFLLAVAFKLFKDTQNSKQSFTDYKPSSFGLITATGT